MLELALALAVQTAQPSTAASLRCDTIFDQAKGLVRGPGAVTEDDEDQTTTTTLTPPPNTRAYLSPVVSISHVEQFSFDTEGFRDTYEITLTMPLIAVRQAIKQQHNFDCIPAQSTNDRCLLPEIGDGLIRIGMNARRQGEQTVVRCYRARPR